MVDYTGTLLGRIVCGITHNHHWRLLPMSYDPMRIACERCGERRI